MADVGVQLLAIGNVEYGLWARNMAVSIRYHSPNIPITLVYEPRTARKINLRQMYRDRRLFSDLKHIDPKHAYVDGKLAPGVAKTYLNQYTTYDTTIYCDVDGIALRPLQTLLDHSGGKPFASHTWDYGTQTDGAWGAKMIWSTPENIWAHFGLKANARYPFINSSLMVYTKEGGAVFAEANRMITQRPMPPKLHRMKWGKGNQPDELYFNAACAALDVDPSLGIQPLYSNSMRTNMPVTEAGLAGYYFMSFWGVQALHHATAYRVYDARMKQYFNADGVEHTAKSHTLMRAKFIKTH